ncbi:hypothetical protein D3C81_1268000 [compost metagenome]
MVIEVGETDHVRSNITGGIEAAELFQAIDTRHFQVEHLLALLRGQPTDQVDELLVGLLSQALSQLLGVLPERCGQLRPAVLGDLHLLGVGPQGGDRRTDSKGFAIAVGDQTTVRWNGNMPQAAGITLTFEEVAIDHLQVDDAPADGTHHQCEQADDYPEAPGVECAFELHHGATIRTSSAAGMRIFNCSAARLSIRLCAVQVLCSRIKRPHSA